MLVQPKTDYMNGGIHSAMSTSPTTSEPSAATTRWQSDLEYHCKERQMTPPMWTLVSDRRGSRTAWSCVVVVQGRSIRGRYWYDGQFLNNAREDAAEVALQFLRNLDSIH